MLESQLNFLYSTGRQAPEIEGRAEGTAVCSSSTWLPPPVQEFDWHWDCSEGLRLLQPCQWLEWQAGPAIVAGDESPELPKSQLPQRLYGL